MVTINQVPAQFVPFGAQMDNGVVEYSFGDPCNTALGVDFWLRSYDGSVVRETHDWDELVLVTEGEER